MNILLVTKTRTEIVLAHKPKNIEDYLKNDGFFSGWRQGFLDAGCKVHLFVDNSFCLPASLAYRSVTLYRALRLLFKKMRFFALDNYWLNRRLAKIIKSHNIDMILTETNDFMQPHVLRQLVGRPIKCIQWFGVYPEMVNMVTKRLFSQYDYILTPCDLGGALLPYVNQEQILFVPVAYAPHIYYPNRDINYAYDIVFIGSIGSAHKNRIAFLEVLAEHYQSIAFWGSGFNALPSNSILRSRYKGYASSEIIRAAYSSAKIALNLTLDNYHRVKRGINERTVAIPACCGALQLVIRVDGVKEFFIEDEEIACFADMPELLKKIDFYLHNEEKRENMVEKAYRKNLGNMYQQRAKYLLATLYQEH